MLCETNWTKKRHILYDSICLPFTSDKNYTEGEQMNCFPGFKLGYDYEGYHGRIFWWWNSSICWLQCYLNEYTYLEKWHRTIHTYCTK